MNIYIDESGSFANATSVGKWNVVAALAVPESKRKKLESLVGKLRLQSAGLGVREVKLNNVAEDQYFHFLAEMGQLDVLVFCTATDAGLNTEVDIAVHQKHQAEGVLKHINKMKHESGRRGVESMAAQLTKLSPQLYVQLTCQIDLMYVVVSRSITYFAQHCPVALREFRWRIDQKNNNLPHFEQVFERLSPALLQSRSIDEPLKMIYGFDYSYMTQYEFFDGKPPEYLKEDYDIDVRSGFNIQNIIRKNIKFVDSKDSYGVQAVDLIASGIRRCLRSGFNNNELAAVRLGHLMLCETRGAPPINLIAFGSETELPKETNCLVNLMSRNSRAIFKSSDI